MFFSIVIPLYNKCYSVERCISSVLAQSFREYEIIIINDGSTDDSLSIIEDVYTSEINSEIIKIINQTNQGVSSARNKGVSLATSDYICFLDADDEWLPDFLKQMVSLINDYPDADLYSLAHMIKKEGLDLIRPKHGMPDHHRGYVDDFFKISTKGSIVKSSKVCVKKGPFLSCGGFPEGVVAGEDLYVWMMLALNGRVACSVEYLCIVHQELDNSRGSRKNSVPYPLVFFAENKDFSKSSSLNKYLFTIFYKHFINSLVSFKAKEAIMRLEAYMKIYI